MEKMTFPSDFSKERRMFQRISAEFPVRFRDPYLGHTGKVSSHNISGGGINLIMEDRMMHPHLLEMWIEVPDNREPIHALGKVAWSKGIPDGRWQTGIRFNESLLMDLNRIIEACRGGPSSQTAS